MSASTTADDGERQHQRPEIRGERRREHRLEGRPGPVQVLQEPRAAATRELTGQIVRHVPRPPRKSERERACRRQPEARPDGPPVPPRRDERGGDHARGQQLSFALRQHHRPQEDRRGGELPGPALEEPEHDEQRRQREEVVEREVRLRLERAADDARADEREEGERPEQDRWDARRQDPGDRGDEAGEQEPELHMQGDDVGRAHEVERRRFERRNERRIRRVRQLAEELLVETAEEVDRLGFRHPERPRVERVEPGQPRGTKERLQVHDDQHRERGTDEPDSLRPVSEDGSRTADPPSHQDSGAREHEPGDHDRRERERSSGHEQERERDSEPCDPEHVREPGEAGELPPRAPAAQAPEQARADSQREEIEGAQPEERPHRHPGSRPTRIPASSSRRISNPSPSSERSQP